MLASSYFVSATGSDSASGTSAAPWKTLQHAGDVMNSGDTAIVRAGNYVGLRLGNNGPDSGLTFKADPGVVINQVGASGRDGIDVESSSNDTFDGFTVIPGGSAWRAAIRFGGAGSNNTIRNCIGRMRSIDTFSFYSSFQTNWTVESCEASGCLDALIYAANSQINPTIRNNYCHDGSGVAGIHCNGDVSQGGLGYIEGGSLSNNRIINVTTGISMDGMENAVVRDNWLSNIHGKGINLFMQDASRGCRNDVVSGNFVSLASDGYFCIGARNGSSGVSIRSNNLIPVSSGPSSNFVLCTDSSSLSGSSWSANVVTAAARASRDNDSTRQAITTLDTQAIQASAGIVTCSIDHSGIVGTAVYLILDTNRGAKGEGYIPGDVTGDGTVGTADYTQLDANRSQALLPAIVSRVPVPATFVPVFGTLPTISVVSPILSVTPIRHDLLEAA